jgi:glycosyltransferase involved in cell wall biosynthesis
LPSRTLLFTSTITAPFIDEDLSLLGRHIRVDHVAGSGIGAVIAILRRAPRAQITYSWFASVYAAVTVASARFLRRPSVVVVGGVDVARHPEIGYGLWITPWKGKLSGFALRHATRVLVVDPSLAVRARERAGYDGANIVWVPTGYDAARWIPSGTKQRRVLTVAACSTPGRVRAKGLDFLAQVAARMPDVPFRLVGIAKAVEGYVRSFAPPNIEILPPLPRSELLVHYQEAKVYCQPSLVEGLPNCVCEAMLCAAVPVGTDVGGIPTAVGRAGECVLFGDLDGLCGAIRKGLDAPEEAGAQARARIASEFTLARREAALVALLEELL